MPDPIERLAAANPVTDCPPLPIDLLRDALASEPERRHRLAPGRSAIGGLVLVMAGVVVALLAVGLSPSRSVISEAYAATADDGTILQYTLIQQQVSTYASDGQQRRVVGPTTSSQVWSSRTRWHTISTTTAVSNRFIQATGETVETAVDGETSLTYSSQAPTIISRVTAQPPGCGSALGLELGQDPACANPIAQVHALLHSKALMMTGTTRFAGRRVDVLTGSPRGRSGRSLPDVSTRILIDPRTYEPVQVSSTQTALNSPSRTGSALTASTFTETFGSYQRLPITAQNLKSLNMDPHLGATVITTRQADLTAQQAATRLQILDHLSTSHPRLPATLLSQFLTFRLPDAAVSGENGAVIVRPVAAAALPAQVLLTAANDPGRPDLDSVKEVDLQSRPIGWLVPGPGAICILEVSGSGGCEQAPGLQIYGDSFSAVGVQFGIVPATNRSLVFIGAHHRRLRLALTDGVYVTSTRIVQYRVRGVNGHMSVWPGG